MIFLLYVTVSDILGLVESKSQRGGLICAHAPILFLLCMDEAFILTPIKMHLYPLHAGKVLKIFKTGNTVEMYMIYTLVNF